MATASLPAPLITANRDNVLAAVARRVHVDRNRHRDRKTKARLGFPPGGPHFHPHREGRHQRLQPIAA